MNDQSLMLTYVLGTKSYGSSASFDPSVSLLLPTGWSATSAAMSATPEPSTMALFGTGIVLMGLMATRKQKGRLNKA